MCSQSISRAIEMSRFGLCMKIWFDLRWTLQLELGLNGERIASVDGQ